MKKNLIITVVSIFSILNASPAVMGGITFKFGQNVDIKNLGTTLKILSSDKENKAVVAAGASYYPWAKNKQLGLDLGVGYNAKKVNMMAGWDFIANQPAVSLGYAASLSSDSKSDEKVIDEETIKGCKNKNK